ncbi:MAG: hypothetical protein JWM07_385 [Candidatus Saccharibacteria bacterium]|nr:hypothetical protein [Candidatus Saccharibacteria bacterium]
MEVKWPTDLLYQPTRRQVIDRYVASFDERDSHQAQIIAESIADPHRPLARYQVLIPVAAHQEAAQIPLALEQYANQQTDQPFTVILGLNSPVSECNNPHIDLTVTAINEARQRYPHLDLRTAMTIYDQPTIGMIRRDLWNGALISSLGENAYDKKNTSDEIIGINHDIDLVSMSPRYIQRIQQFYRMRQQRYVEHGMTAPLGARSTTIKHATSLEHPNISKTIFWSDYSARQMGSSFEAGLVFPMSHYAMHGGFRTLDALHETRPLFQHPPFRHAIAGTTIETSPRRYIDRVQHGYDNIWTPDSFGATDGCRAPGDAPDISHQQVENIINQRASWGSQFEPSLVIMAQRAMQLHGTKKSVANIATFDIDKLNNPRKSYREERDEYAAIYDKSIRLSAAVLARVIGSEHLTKRATRLMEDIHYKNSSIDKIFKAPTDR